MFADHIIVQIFLFKDVFCLARFFVDPEQVFENSISIFGDDVKHISKVLRLRINEEITVCDKCGNDYECSLQEISSDKVVAKILSKKKNVNIYFNISFVRSYGIADSDSLAIYEDQMETDKTRQSDKDRRHS